MVIMIEILTCIMILGNFICLIMSCCLYDTIDNNQIQKFIMAIGIVLYAINVICFIYAFLYLILVK